MRKYRLARVLDWWAFLHIVCVALTLVIVFVPYLSKRFAQDGQFLADTMSTYVALFPNPISVLLFPLVPWAVSWLFGGPRFLPWKK